MFLVPICYITATPDDSTKWHQNTCFNSYYRSTTAGGEGGGDNSISTSHSDIHALYRTVLISEVGPCSVFGRSSVSSDEKENGFLLKTALKRNAHFCCRKKVKFTKGQATKAQMGSRSIALLFM
jgi:hypothetical protein